MADYIYLLQNRLTPAQRLALEAVREAARSRGMPVFVVGGAVRDLSSGAPVRDLDFAVQGDTAELVDELQQGGAVIAGRNPVLSSVYLIFRGGARVELGPTLTISYPKPGQPEPHPAVILDDLRRRDFTANAMAVSLNEGSYGLLLDPLNGIADIENRELRLVSNYGFIEQPSLLIRAARLSNRLGFTLEERTQSRYDTAKEEKYIDGISSFDRGYELEEVFHEDDPLATMEHLTAEGWNTALYPAWTAAKADHDALDRMRDLMGQMEQMGIFVDPSPDFFPLLTAKLAGKDVSAIKAMFPRQGFVAQIDSLEARSKELSNQLTSRNAAPSETWKLLFAAEPEVVLWLAYTSRSGAVQTKFKAFLTEWPQARQRLPYALMQEMRITADLPGYDQLLEDLFFAQIDGKLATPEATRAFLEPHSPPAPVVQAPPRRRPAKATRGRGRKAVGVEEVVTPEVEAEFPGTAEVLSGAPEGTAKGDATEREQGAAQPAVAKKAAKAPAKQSAAAKVAVAAAPAAPPEKHAAHPPAKAPAKAVAKTPEKHAPAAKKAAVEPVKKATAEKKAAPPAKAAKAPAKSVPPAHKKAAVKHAAPPAKAAKGKSAPSPAKKKTAPAKAPVRPVKTAGKVAHKATSVKAAAGRHAPVKAAVKKSAAPARKNVPAKKSAPAKKGRSAPAKGRR